MPITQDRIIAVIQAGIDHSAALDSICALIREAHGRTISGELPAQDALDRLIQWAKPSLLLADAAKSKTILLAEQHWYSTHARGNRKAAERAARKADRIYQPQGHPIGELDMNKLPLAQTEGTLNSQPSAMQQPLTPEAGDIIERRVRDRDFDNRKLREWMTMEPLKVRQFHSILVGSEVKYPNADTKLIAEYERHMRGELEPRDRSWIDDESQWNEEPKERAGGPDTIYDPQNDPLDQLQRRTRDSQSSDGET